MLSKKELNDNLMVLNYAKAEMDPYLAAIDVLGRALGQYQFADKDVENFLETRIALWAEVVDDILMGLQNEAEESETEQAGSNMAAPEADAGYTPNEDEDNDEIIRIDGI